MMPVTTVVTTFFLATAGAFVAGQLNGEAYYGTRIGKFSTHFHDVSGDVYAVDERTIFIKNFNYDGNGIDTFFWAGKSVRPDPSGFSIADENGSLENLQPYSNKDIVLRLPQGKRLTDIRWLSVWSKRFRANFGSLIFPKSIQPPRPAIIGQLQNTKHGVSSGDIMILDTQTFLIQDFSYDGSREGVFWWLSRGLKANTGGIQLLDENHSRSPLRKYINETVVVSLPEGHIVFDYDVLSVWSSVDIQDYGMVKISKDIKVPPSARALGLSSQNKMNCEMLNDNLGFEARWVVEEEQLIMQLIGKFEANEYMVLGFSKDDTETKFSSADAVLAYLSDDGRGHAIDYFLQSTEKCENGKGMCPDTTFEEANNSITLLNAGKVKDRVTITFRRPLRAVDEKFDQNIYTDGPQAVLWAIGDISKDNEAMPPKLRTRGNLLLDFGRDPLWNCPSQESNSVNTPESTESKVPENVAKVHCPMDLTFRAQLGPSMKINKPDRIWYINGLPSPDITIQRGQTYTFIVEGGSSPPIHHPLYITNSEEGGIYQKILEANEDGEIVYAGVASDPITGALLPTAEGRLCEWTSTNDAPQFSVVKLEMGEQPSLKLNCAPGKAGILTWTPEVNSSELIFYQSFIQKNIGGRIRVVEFCEETLSSGYMEESDTNQDNLSIKNFNVNKDLERESENVSSETLEGEDSKTLEEQDHFDSDNIEDKKESQYISQNGSQYSIYEHNENDKHILSYERSQPSESNNAIDIRTQSFSGKGTSHNIHQPIHKVPNTMNQDTSTGNFAVSSYPHNEHERSDTSILDNSNNGNPHHKRVPSPGYDLQRDSNRISTDRTLPLKTALHAPTQTSHSLNVQFEGGFVPLVLNPLKEKESSLNPDYIPPPHYRRHRPFLFNESIPFHGTFKPGVPDFSGFNISYYTQAANFIDQNHLPDHIALLSSSKPQLLQRPILGINGLPPDFFRRPHNAIHRPQAPNYNLKPQMIVLPGHHEPMFFQLPKQPNFILSQPGSDDLDEGSSQRVPITLQSPSEKKVLTNKNIVPGFPIHQPGNRNIPTGYIPPKNIPPSPPIQRRPDIVDEDGSQPKKLPSNKIHSSSQPSRDQQIRPSNIPLSRVRPALFDGIQHGNAPLPYHQVLPAAQTNMQDHKILNQPNLFIKRPVGTYHLEQSSKPNNPFVYHLPDRPIAPSVLRHPQKLHGSTDSQDDYPSVIMPYGAMPSQEGRPMLKQNFMSPQNAPLEPERLFFQNNPGLSSEHEILNKPQQEKQSYVIPTSQDEAIVASTHNGSPDFHLQSMPSDTENIANHEEFPSTKNEQSSEYEENSYEESEDESEKTNLPQEYNESADTPIDNEKIISVDQSQSQEIHLPPVIIKSSPEIVHSNTENKHGDNFKDQNIKSEEPVQFYSEHEESDLYQKQYEKAYYDVPENTNDHLLHISNLDYDYDNVPFGARLSVKQSFESNTPTKQMNKPTAPKQPTYFPARRQPQYSSPPPKGAIHSLETASTYQPEKKPSFVTESPQIEKKPDPSNDLITYQNTRHSIISEANKPLAINPGRKNILPSESGQKNERVEPPPKMLDDIKLPHISEKPLTHDNGTDYSILSHVLSLIGGQPHGNPSPRNAEGAIHLDNEKASHS